jgi:hypothetical protein
MRISEKLSHTLAKVILSLPKVFEVWTLRRLILDLRSLVYPSQGFFSR